MFNYLYTLYALKIIILSAVYKQQNKSFKEKN